MLLGQLKEDNQIFKHRKESRSAKRGTRLRVCYNFPSDSCQGSTELATEWQVWGLPLTQTTSISMPLQQVRNRGTEDHQVQNRQLFLAKKGKHTKNTGCYQHAESTDRAFMHAGAGTIHVLAAPSGGRPGHYILPSQDQRSPSLSKGTVKR